MNFYNRQYYELIKEKTNKINTINKNNNNFY